MSGFARYDSYKDSGVEWLGDIPSHWEISRAKRIFRTVSEKGYPDAELLSVTQAQGVVPRSWLEQRVVMPVGQLQTFKLVRENDFVISLRSFQGGIEYSEHTGLVSPAYTVLRQQRDMQSQYLKHLLKSAGFISELNTNVTGIRQGKNIDFGELSYSFLPIPSLPEQTRIANFLDQKTAEIDEAIAKKQRLIDLLQEQKAILINQAVTKGLNPDAPMRDSGVEWIGEIPAHWEIKRVKHITRSVLDGTHVTPTYVEDGIPFLRVTDISSGNPKIDMDKVRRISENEHQELCKRVQGKKGDILLSKNGTIGITKVVDWNFEFSFFVSLCLIKPKPMLIPEYFCLFFDSPIVDEQLSHGSKRTSVTNLHLDKIKELIVILPPVEEQKTIMSVMSLKLDLFHKTIAKIKYEIELIAELKSVYIADAVTGKIKI